MALKKAIGGFLALLFLAGCGTPPLATQGAAIQSGTAQIMTREGFTFGLGADVSGDPGVTMDENYEIQALPAKVDLRNQCSPVANQGKFGSCTAFATVKGLQEFLLIRAHRFVPQSPSYLWYLSRKQRGERDKDTGVPTEFAVKMLDAYGSPAEAEFPYLDPSKQEDPSARLGFLTRQPSRDLIGEAKKNRLLTGLGIATKLSAVRRSLADGMPVLLSMLVYDSIGKTPATGLLPLPTAADKVVGGHAVMVVGYDNQKRVLIIRNSWGAKWADAGYFYMPYEYVKTGNVRVAVIPKIANE